MRGSCAKPWRLCLMGDGNADKGTLCFSLDLWDGRNRSSPRCQGARLGGHRRRGHQGRTGGRPRAASAKVQHAGGYVLVGELKNGDTVEVELFNDERSLMHNTQTLAEDQGSVLLQAGKRGVPAGGWPEGSYHAKLTITRGGKPLVEQSSKPIAFE